MNEGEILEILVDWNFWGNFDNEKLVDRPAYQNRMKSLFGARRAGKSSIAYLFVKDLKYGGFPEVVLSDSESRKKELLTNYFVDITTKDIVKRFGIREMGDREFGKESVDKSE